MEGLGRPERSDSKQSCMKDYPGKIVVQGQSNFYFKKLIRIHVQAAVCTPPRVQALTSKFQ